ncbi:MAG: flagellar export chaperone FliS [Solirubrobacterales bacterium]
MNPYAASTAAYQQQAVLTATPGQLVVMLYDGAIRFLRQADVAMGEGAVPTRTTASTAPRRSSTSCCPRST